MITDVREHPEFQAAIGHLSALVESGCDCEYHCIYCGTFSVFGGDDARCVHEPDCSYVAAKDFLNKLDAPPQEA